MSFYSLLICTTLIVLLLLIEQLRCEEEEGNIFPLKDAEITGDEIPFRKLENTRFSIGRKRVTQAEALTICERNGREDRLAVLSTITEAFDLSMHILQISDKYTPEYDKQNATTEWGPDRRYWIGLIDYIEEGDWQWVKSEAEFLSYEFWTYGQPDHNTERNKRPEHCATLWNPNYFMPDAFHTFNDEDCTSKYYFVCEDVPKKPENHTEEAQQQGRSIGRLLHIDNQDDSDESMPFGVVVESGGRPSLVSKIGSKDNNDRSLETLSKESDTSNEIDLDKGSGEAHNGKGGRSLIMHGRTFGGGLHSVDDDNQQDENNQDNKNENSITLLRITSEAQGGENNNSGTTQDNVSTTPPMIAITAELNNNIDNQSIVSVKARYSNTTNVDSGNSAEKASNELIHSYNDVSNQNESLKISVPKPKIVNDILMENTSSEIIHLHDNNVRNQSVNFKISAPKSKVVNDILMENTSSEIIHFHKDNSNQNKSLNITVSKSRIVEDLLKENASSEIAHFYNDVSNQNKSLNISLPKSKIVDDLFMENTSSEIIHFHNDDSNIKNKSINTSLSKSKIIDDLFMENSSSEIDHFDNDDSNQTESMNISAQKSTLVDDLFTENASSETNHFDNDDSNQSENLNISVPKSKILDDLLRENTSSEINHFHKDDSNRSENRNIISIPKSRIVEDLLKENASNEIINFYNDVSNQNESLNISFPKPKIVNDLLMENASSEIIHSDTDDNNSSKSVNTSLSSSKVVENLFKENTSSEIIDFHNDVNNPSAIQPTSSPKRHTSIIKITTIIIPTASSTINGIESQTEVTPKYNNSTESNKSILERGLQVKKVQSVLL